MGTIEDAGGFPPIAEANVGLSLRPLQVNGGVRRLDWIEQGLTSHSTHFRSFRTRWGDYGISQDCSRSQSPQVLSSVCMTTVDNSGVYVCYLKGIMSVCFRCPAKNFGFLRCQERSPANATNNFAYNGEVEVLK